jgi:UDP-N-acetylglucosamine/UDP-N-acetylgalactosamine diphosphorylase
MTSPATHQPSIAFFEANDYFGYPPEYVSFFEQATLPCLTTDGKISENGARASITCLTRCAVMESGTAPSRSPNGNGGLYSAMAETGVLQDMQSRGIAHVFVFSVDNVLVQVADPEFVGFCTIMKSI